ncbi:leucine-rich repeat flightless-interacting protein 1 isoform X22 [Xenopus tropicalis]|uniref:Leucine-rich repeat flightless-interacting protein 1 isoform X22 n=1 Tax=Xenopus tropicalis TaxID=8364 RepID=A0A8J0SP26_XENTR|nr:leucine-rich repeat flightless-interacting protein 1 isoform X22 [Xenopus tropicalis]
MGTQGPGRKRHPNQERLSAEDQALNQIAREAEARLAAKRAARAEAREIRMKELERQQKEIYQVQKKYYGLDAKWGDIEQWMEDSERYSHRARRTQQGADDDDLMSVGSRSSLRTNGYEDELLGATQYRKSSRSSTGSGETYQSSRAPPQDESTYYSDMSLASASLTSKPQQAMHNGNRPSLLNCNTLPSRSQRSSLYDDGIASGSRRYSSSSSKPPSEYSCYLGSGSRASSRASSARASPVNSEPPGSTVFRRGSACGSVSTLSHVDDVPPVFGVEERPEKDFSEKGSRPVSSLSAATLASLGGTSSRRGSGDTSISVDTEASIREIKDSLAEVEEKYKRSMVTNAQLDNEKTSLQYQVDTLRDVLLELEEELAESRRQHEEKNKECERQKHEHNVLRFQLAELKDALEQREQLLTKHGIALDSEDTPNGDASIEPHIVEECHMESPQKATALGKADESDVREQEISVVSQRAQAGHEQEREKEPVAEQDREEEQEKTPEEFPFQAANNNVTDFQRIQELTSNNSVELKPVPSADDSCSQTNFGQSLSQQGEECKTSSKQPTSEEEGGNQIKGGEVVEGEGTMLGHIISVVEGEVTQNQKGGSPGESELFQDALDFVKQTQNVTDECVGETAFTLSSSVTGDFQDQKVEKMEKDHKACSSESTIPESGSEVCDGTENIRAESSSWFPSEESAETSSDSDEFCETGENFEISGPKVGYEKHEGNLIEFTPNESSLTMQERELEPVSLENTEEALPTLESAKQTVDGDCETIRTDLISTHKEETTETFKENEDKIEDVIHPQSQKPGSENEAVTLLACDSNTAADGQECGHFTECENLKADNEKQEYGLVVADSDDNEGLTDSTLGAGLESSSKSHNENANLSEGENVVPGEQQGQKEEFLGKADNEENMTQNADEHECKPAHTETLVTKEAIVKNQEKDDVEDDNYDDENGSNEEEEDHDEEEDTGPSEKYQGESEIRLGSSVDMTSSSEDVRPENNTNKTPKLGKGKNKEDCVIS